MFVPLLAPSHVGFVLHLKEEVSLEVLIEGLHFIKVYLGFLLLCTLLGRLLLWRARGLRLRSMTAPVPAHVNVFYFRCFFLEFRTQILDV